MGRQLQQVNYNDNNMYCIITIFSLYEMGCWKNWGPGYFR